MNEYKDSWIPLQHIEEVYEGVSKGSLMTSAHQERKEGNDVSHWYRPLHGKRIEVNIGYLNHIWERRRKIQFECHDLYYELTDKYSESEIAKMFAKYIDIEFSNAYMFLTNGLFANTYFINISKIYISRKMIAFHNFCNELKEDLYFNSVDDEYDYYEAKKLLHSCC